MPEIYDKVPAARYTVKYKDYFHLKHFYMMTYHWLLEEGWCSTDEPDFNEVFYIQRDLPKMDRYIRYGWRLEKDAPNSKGFIKYHLDINAQVTQLRDAEIVYQGQKYSTNWGEMRMEVESYLRVDPESKWAKHWFLKHFNKIFRTRIYRDIILKHRQELYRDAYRFQEAVKGYFDLRTYLPEPEDQAGLLFPKKGVGEA